MKTVQNKLKSRRGSTLSEMLMVVLILLLVGSIVAAGLPAGINAYRKVVDSANAQLLLSTTVSSLRRELGLAKEVKTSGGSVVGYTNGETGYDITLVFRPATGYKGIARRWTAFDGAHEQPLVTEKAATRDMITSFTGISYADGVFTVTGLTVTKNGRELARLDKPLLIRAVMGAEASTT